MSDWPTTERRNDPKTPRLTLEEERPADDSLDDSDDIDEAVIDRDEEAKRSRPAEPPSEKLMD